MHDERQLTVDSMFPEFGRKPGTYLDLYIPFRESTKAHSGMKQRLVVESDSLIFRLLGNMRDRTSSKVICI
jgi:hypothetical protein